MQANVHVSMQSVYKESNQRQTELMLQSTTGQEEWLSLCKKLCGKPGRFFSPELFITNTTGTTGRMIHQVTIYTFSNRNSERSDNTVKVTKSNIFTPNKVKPDMNTVLLHCLHHIDAVALYQNQKTKTRPSVHILRTINSVGLRYLHPHLSIYLYLSTYTVYVSGFWETRQKWNLCEV